MIAAIIKGLALGLMLSISVGPVIFSIIKQSINNGHKAGYTFVAGVSASDITLVLVCNFFTSLFDTALNHKVTIAVTGSLFLIGLGIYNIFFKKVSIDEEGNAAEKTFRKRDFIGIFISGYFMNILNPGVFLFWFACSASILADSQNVEYLSPFEYRLIVFGICLLFVLTADISKVLLAGKLRPKLTPRNMHHINQLSGLILVGFGVALIWGILKYGNLIH